MLAPEASFSRYQNNYQKSSSRYHKHTVDLSHPVYFKIRYACFGCTFIKLKLVWGNWGHFLLSGRHGGTSSRRWDEARRPSAIVWTQIQPYDRLLEGDSLGTESFRYSNHTILADFQSKIDERTCFISSLRKKACEDHKFYPQFRDNLQCKQVQSLPPGVLD